MAIRWWISILVIMNAMNSYLALPKGTVMTIETDYGEGAHCVDIYRQPAFANPLLHYHSIQMKPTKIPQQGIKLDDESCTRMQVQTWPCPNGTVPILSSTLNVTVNSSRDLHKGLRMANFAIKSDKQDPTETIETGWMINPHDIKSSNKSILFVFFQNDANPKGCYNLDCPGFVLTNERFGLGSRVYPSLTRDGRQQDVNIAVLKDMKTGNWWVYLEYDPVGYWPRELFLKMGPRGSDKKADIRKAGGHVAQWERGIVNSDHPTWPWTQMGGGGAKRAAACMDRVVYYDVNGEPQVPNRVTSRFIYRRTT